MANLKWWLYEMSEADFESKHTKLFNSIFTLNVEISMKMDYFVKHYWANVN